MSEANGKTQTNRFSLTQAREQTPPPVGLGTWAAKMKAAAVAAISEDDIAAILGKQIEKAKSGDATAAKFVLGFMAAQEPPPKEVKIIEKVKVIHRASKRKGEPTRVVESSGSELPAPVAIDSPSVEQLRMMVGLYLALNHNSSIAELERALSIPNAQLKAVLNCELFTHAAGRYGLSPAGNQRFK